MKLTEAQYVLFFEGLIEREKEVRGKGKLADNMQHVALKLGLPPGIEYYERMNNVHREYSALFSSGAATPEVPLLRRSTAVFEAFDKFMKAFYPRGSSAVPAKIIEPGKVYVPSTTPEKGACSSNNEVVSNNSSECFAFGTDQASVTLLSYLPVVRTMDSESLRAFRTGLDQVVTRVLQDQERRNACRQNGMPPMVRDFWDTLYNELPGNHLFFQNTQDSYTWFK